MNYEVNKIIQELYTCLPNDRTKFDIIMSKLREGFLESKNNSDIKFPNTGYNSSYANDKIFINKFKNENVNHKKYKNQDNELLNPSFPLANFQPINLPTNSYPNKDNNADELRQIYNNENYLDNMNKNDMNINNKYNYQDKFKISEIKSKISDEINFFKTPKNATYHNTEFS